MTNAQTKPGQAHYPQSPSRAIELYERAAQQGSALAHWTLGLEYERSNKHGALRKARAHYSRCSEALPSYCWKLGELDFFGIGGPKRVGAALKLFRRAARTGGSPEAEVYLGLAAEQGIGVTKHRARAIGWYRRAAANPYSWSEGGDPIALTRLAQLLAGTRKAAECQSLAERAAAGGLPSGMVLLAQSLIQRSAARARAKRLLRKALSVEPDWKVKFDHWRAIQDQRERMMAAARLQLQVD